MSFEGYYQRACARGHNWQEDCYTEAEYKCPECGLKPVINNLVDDTNCEAAGYLTPAQLFSKLKWGGPDL